MEGPTLKRTTSIAAVALMAMLAAPALATAEGPSVTQVFVVDVEPRNVEAYLGKLKRAQEIIEALGLPGFRVLQSTLAGPNTGQIAVVVESKDLATLAANQARIQASEDWQKWVDDVVASGISRIASNSLWIDVTP
jgi:hypothetical protein